MVVATSPYHSLTMQGVWALSKYVRPKHPPNKKYRDNGPRDVNRPVASCFRFPKIEHAAMVAGPAQLTSNCRFTR